MTYNPKIHNRQSIRLKGYDYSQSGLYFITICCQNNAHMFGRIINGEMILNDAGKMIEKWYYELQNKYPDKRCHEMVVMPNHFHCILENMDIDSSDTHGRTSPRGRPRGCSEIETGLFDSHETIEKMFDVPPYGPNNKKYQSPLGDAIGWFKTMTTNEYIRGVKTLGWKRFDKKLWHWNYFDRIIRNQYAYNNITRYIKNNPENWKKDKFGN